jgi:hypothetical protein
MTDDENGQKKSRKPGRLENPDELEIDEVIRLMGTTPPPPKRQDAKEKAWKKHGRQEAKP